MIPKANQPLKWRLILDLSYPNGASINDGIDLELCSLQYITVDTVVGDILGLGTGALLVKFDIEHAYHNVSVHRTTGTRAGSRKFYLVGLM